MRTMLGLMILGTLGCLQAAARADAPNFADLEDAVKKLEAKLTGPKDRSVKHKAEIEGVRQAITKLRNEWDNSVNSTVEAYRKKHDNQVMEIMTMTRRSEELTGQVADLNEEINTLRGKTKEADTAATRLEQERDRERQRNRMLTTWGGVALGVLSLVATLLLRLRGKQTAQVPQPMPRPFVGSSRPDMFARLGPVLFEYLPHARIPPEGWPAVLGRLQAALQQLLDEPDGNKQAEVAMFLCDYLVPLLASRDPDPGRWAWTQNLACQGCPSGWQVKLLPSPAPGSTLLQMSEQIEAPRGSGDRVREVLCPGRQVVGPGGQVLRTLRATVEC
jgi:hypothetical protein